MTSQLSCPLTVKMRVGWDEKKPNADSVSVYEACHGRTAPTFHGPHLIIV